MENLTKSELIEKLGTLKDCINLDGKANQFIITFENGRMFKSYDSIIAIKYYNNSNIILGKDWNYSTTTGKYRNMFLNMDKKELEKLIKNNKAIINNDLQ